jgi:hypothetical protein
MADAGHEQFEEAGNEVEDAREEADDQNRTEVAQGRPETEASARQEAALLALLSAQRDREQG